MTTARRVHDSYREYLEALEVSTVKLEFCEGEIYAMPGGSPAHAPEDPNAVINPTLLVEVTSSSTEDYDRGEKLSHYKQLPSLRAVLIASHRRPQVSVIERSEHGWTQTEVRSGETVRVAALGLELAVDELYAGIDLASEKAGR